MSIVQMSVSASFIIAAVIIIRALLMCRLPKKTFMALWSVALCRLLIPFSIPAKTSVFGLIEYIRDQITVNPDNIAISQPVSDIGVSQDMISYVGDVSERIISSGGLLRGISPLHIVWFSGIVILVIYFALVYLKCRREFSSSLPCENAFISTWYDMHELSRAYFIRTSDKITVPLTYGVFKPVILLPKKTDFSDEKKLAHILMHEYVHIRKFDAVTKLVAATVLCVHWFNPFVWCMYILLNRDIEISCDERVVGEFGETLKSAYALTLIEMAENKSILLPLFSGFSKYAIEERICAIMKTKKSSIVGILVAAALVVGTASIFATSAFKGAEMREGPSSEMPVDQQAPASGQYRLLRDIGEEKSTSENFDPEKYGLPNSGVYLLSAIDGSVQNIATYNGDMLLLSDAASSGWMLKAGETASIEIDIDLSAEYSDSQRGELMAIGYFHEGVFTPITTDYCDKVTPGTIYSFTAPEAGEYFWYLENFCAVTQNLASVKVKRFFAL